MKIYDTLSGSERELEPADGNRVRIYACGPTVYAPIHVGNARPFVVFSLLKRYLEHEGFEVTLVANITDVNDKIYAAAGDGGSSTDLAREMTDRYIADTDRLLLGRPDIEPRATQTIKPIVGLIDDLIESGHAYASDGDVYFRVRSFPEYGKLSNRPVEEMDQGEDDEGPKQDRLDFALWKAQKPGEDTAWDAPWGRGRPGWHIECSAMAEEAFGGVDFEIHGGGSDLIFPHHENEIAQTEAARGEPLAKIWMHNGMLQFDREKMSKSVGNISLLSVALDEYGRDALVMFFVRSHYRKPVDYSPEALADAARAVERIRDLGRRLDGTAPPPDLSRFESRFYAALADDFNTPAALSVVFDCVAELNRRVDAGERVGAGPLREMLWTLGLDDLLESDADAPPSEAERLAAEREDARRAKDFSTADARRDELAALGWEVRDTPAGPRLVRRG